MPQRPPNILFIMADQLAANTVGSYGNASVRTPHLDALAADGLRFDSAYCNCPICGPSRASLCTGQPASALQAFDNASEFPAATPTFLHHLRRQGYQTLLSGKMHFVGPDQYHGFERRLTTDIYPSDFSWVPDWRRGAYPNPGTSVEQLKDAGKCNWSMQLDYDEEVTFRSLEALRDLARSDADRPFFLCASYTHPHDPFIINDPWWSLYEGASIPPPAAPPQPLDSMHAYNQWLQIHHRVPEFPPEEASIRNARRAYYGMVSYFDSQVGRLLEELDRVGLRENTLVVVTSDHGEMLGEHGMWFKRTFFEPSVKVPLIVQGPGVRGAGRTSRRTVSLLDLFPTFVEYAKVSDYPEIQMGCPGHSLIPDFEDSRSSGTDPGILIEYFSEGVCQPMRTWVQERKKLVEVHEEPSLFFDLEKDPHECVNRFQDADYHEGIRSMQQSLAATGDPATQRQQVLDSQKRRFWIRETFGEGSAENWDVKPDYDDSRYVRDYDAQESSKRRRL